MARLAGRMGGGDRQDLVRAARALFERTFGEAPAFVASAPGRINVIGEHTDYNDGLAMPGAIDRWVVVALSPRDDDRVEVYSEAFDERAAAPLRREAQEDGGGWSRLPLGVARVFAEVAGASGGFRATISGDLTVGAGLSSSAAVEVALLNALRAAFGATVDDATLILAAQRVEHESLGVATGLMDQYTSQFSRPGSLMLIDFAAATHEYVEADLDGWAWLLLDTKVRHLLSDSAYGDRVRESRQALAQVARAHDRVRSFRDLESAHLEAVEDPLLRARLRHYISENGRVRGAAQAIAGGDVEKLGALMLASHASLRDDYGVSCVELDLLVDAAQRTEECAGARMMGGGFGGCTLNLVRADAVVDLVARIAPEFARQFRYSPDAGVYRLVGGVRVH